MDVREKVRIFRERFKGRHDVYGRKWSIKDDKGVERMGYTPVCENLWKDFCHLKLKDKIGCASCAHKQYHVVSDDTVLKHIQGDEEHIYYMLGDDGYIDFAALDFDFKQGKEEFGYKWEDIKITSAILNDFKIPHSIARSTTFGFHIYFFFDKDRCKANLFRSVLFEVFDRAGFLEQSRQGVRPLPEIFPKQSYSGPHGIGNGIKPPMIEHRFAVERNGFVTPDGLFLSQGEQWQYLDSLPRTTQKLFEEIIEQHNIIVIEQNNTHSSAPSSTSRGSFQRNTNANGKQKWQPPLTGSIDKLVEGCEALRDLAGSCRSGKIPGHHEGMALWHMCLATSDGVEWFNKNVPGWAQTESDKRQLQYSVEKNYTPHSCEKMQMIGVCKKGTKCFNKKPPKEIVEGRYIDRDDVPRDQWPEPSPIRYAYGDGEDYLRKLIAQASLLKDEIDPKVKVNKLADLIFRIQAFDDDQLKLFKNHVKGLKMIATRDLNSMFELHGEARNKKAIENADSRDDTVRVNEATFLKWTPHGYGLLKFKRGQPTPVQLCGFDLWIQEQRIYQDENDIMRAVFTGVAQADRISCDFEIECSKWYDTQKFTEYFGQKLGSKFLANRADLEGIRQAAMKFSEKNGIERTSYILTQGWYDDTYVMPSVVVDRDGVRPNTERKIDLTSKQIARELDFKILSEGEFKQVLMHIKADFLDAWPFKWGSFALSHAFMAGITHHLEITKKPALFFEGLTGSGKTELMQTVAFFWGDFRRIANLSSTGLGIQEAAHDFKDALLVIDDYKGASLSEKHALETTIQHSYNEGSVRLKMKRDGTQAAAKDSRSLLMFTGEEFLSSDSAKVSRCILIDIDKYDTSKTKEKYLRCISMRKYYAGVMPRFLNWFLNLDHSNIKDRTSAIEDILYAKGEGKTNSQRVAYNLSRSRISFELFCEFMQFYGIADSEECVKLLERHWTALMEVYYSMVNKCEQAQNGVVFARILVERLEAGELSIKGVKPYERETMERKPVIGFAKVQRSGRKQIFLYPDITYKEILSYASIFGLSGSKEAIVRQMIGLGYIMPDTAVVRDGEGFKRMWAIDHKKIGLNFDDEGFVETVKQPEPDSSGVY